MFDLGEVLTEAPGHLDSLAAALGAERAAAVGAYWRFRNGYDRGQDALAYWQDVGSVLGVPVDQTLAARLTDIDSEGWLRLHPDSLPLLRDVRDAGLRLALLSNLSTVMARRVERLPWSALFEVRVFSADVGLAKPDPAIYAEVTRRMRRASGSDVEVVFFDDRAPNVAGGRAAGWRAHLWTGHEDARALLAEAGSPVGQPSRTDR